MCAGPQLATERLLLRRWRAGDEAPFAALNGDPEVMEHFPGVLSARESAALIARNEELLETLGYGLWAVELRASGVLIGAVGLIDVNIDLPLAPAVEIGWRIARGFWGRGLALEAATAARTHGFDTLGLAALVSYTAARNRRSRRLMERLGMSREPAEDFLHPLLDPGDPLAPHVLYRLERASTRSASDAGCA